MLGACHPNVWIVLSLCHLFRGDSLYSYLTEFEKLSEEIAELGHEQLPSRSEMTIQAYHVSTPLFKYCLVSVCSMSNSPMTGGSNNLTYGLVHIKALKSPKHGIPVLFFKNTIVPSARGSRFFIMPCNVFAHLFSSFLSLFTEHSRYA
ncbi:hypothetical protein Tco_0936617 [Tanacetum coccineum]|uniref:Uncharacterized protein n=1 Tax=Tanacetum coccineum TaxID=301880 RepID=A0ABQ5DEJ4_9ASTR